MLREFTCIMCPLGCSLEVTEENGQVLEVKGNTCPTGREYAVQEVTAPMRNIASSIRIEGGELPLASVRLSAPIPKKDIFRAMEEIRRVSRKAPVHIGDVVISHLLGTDADVIVTKNVNAAHAAENL